MELVNMVTPNKLKNIQTLGSSDTQSDKLYWLLQKGLVETDEEAQAQLYPGKKSKTSLYHAKEKLYNKLLDSIIVINPIVKNSSQYSIAFHNCLKLCTAFEKASLKGGKKATINLGEKILKISLHYNLCFIIVRVSRVLMRKAMYVLRDEKKIEYYRSLYIKYLEIEQLQELSRYYWVKIAFHTSRKRMLGDKSLIEEIQNYIDELELKLVPGHTAITFTFINSLKIRIEELKLDHEKVIELIDEYLLILPTYKSVHSNFYTNSLNTKLTALITLRKFDDARTVAKDILDYASEGNGAWYTAQENIIILHFYTAQYSKAFQVFEVAINNNSFKFLPPDRQEIFKVYRAYLQFFINIGLLSIENKKHKAYRSAKFSNEIPIFSKDKTGINITIIIAQFLLLFTEEKYQEAIEKIDYIKQYTKSNLRNDATFRSNCFLKMLVKLIESNYHKSATQRKTKTLYGKLKNHPAEIQRQTSHVEIVPYEVLWDILMDSIDNSFRGKVKKKPEE